MRRDHRAHSPRGGRMRRGSLPVAGEVPDPPEATFGLERTPLPGRARAPSEGAANRAAQSPPGTVCPKCDSPLSPSEAACPSCGLRRAMFGRYRAGSHPVPAALEALWREVESSWSDPELHERFLAQVSLCGAYAYAASRYRQAARSRQSDAIAKLQLERISRMVHAVMAVSAVRPGDEPGARPYRGIIALLVLLVGLGALGGIYMMRRRGAAAEDRAESVPSTIKVRRGRSTGSDGRPAPAFGGLHPARPPAPPAAATKRVEGEDPPAEGRSVEGEGEVEVGSAEADE